MHLCSIRTCPNGIRVQWQLCKAVSAISFPLSAVVVFLRRQLDFTWSQFSHDLLLSFLERTFYCCDVLFFLSLSHPLLQCFLPHLCSIRTCQNGIRARLQLWNLVSAIFLIFCRHAFRYCVFKYDNSSFVWSQFSHFFVCFWNGTFCCFVVVCSFFLRGTLSCSV